MLFPFNEEQGGDVRSKILLLLFFPKASRGLFSGDGLREGSSLSSWTDVVMDNAWMNGVMAFLDVLLVLMCV